jgi:hypothetical protein
LDNSASSSSFDADAEGTGGLNNKGAMKTTNRRDFLNLPLQQSGQLCPELPKPA